jgi:hypothetical protein
LGDIREHTSGPSRRRRRQIDGDIPGADPVTSPQSEDSLRL